MDYFKLVLLYFAQFLLFCHPFVANNLQTGFKMTSMDPGELDGLFSVMEAIIEDPKWRSTHPHPCTDDPWPGIECEATPGTNNDIVHVTKLHIGLDYTTPCRNNATLSSAILKLPYLKSLFIINCFHTSNTTIPSQLIKLSPSLEQLVFRSNTALIGSIPPQLSGLSKLKLLSLSQNGLQGPIPSELGKLDMLNHLDLSHNKLTGSIPQELGGLKSLSILDLSENSLQGLIPPSLGNLLVLEKIDLSYNNLSGKVPPDLGKLHYLCFLALSRNKLNGPFPSTFGLLKNLQYLMVERNPMNCTLPDFLGSLHNLSELILSSSEFVGMIPKSFSGLHNLSTLALDNNRLNGSIPWGMQGLQHLFLLNLRKNMLSGEVPFSKEFVKRLGRKLELMGNKDLCAGKVLYGVFPAKEIRQCSEEPITFQEVDYKGSPSLSEDGHGKYSSGFSRIQLLQELQYVVLTASFIILQMHEIM